MKRILIIIAVLICGVANAQTDYKITLNGSTFNVSPDSNYSVMVNGRKENFRMTVDDTLTYNDSFIRFKYTKDYSVSKVEVDSGIQQLMIVSAGGTGIILQEYASFDPSDMGEMMVKEMTKKNSSYGYALTRNDYERGLQSGDSVHVDKAIMTYKGDTDIYEVAVSGQKDKGVLVVTMSMHSNDENLSHQGQEIIDLMWASLIIK